MKGQRTRAVVLAALMILSVVTVASVPVAAQPQASLTASGAPSTVSPGSTFTVEYTLTNTGDENASTAGLQITLPSDVTVENINGPGSGSPSRFFTSGLDAGESVTVTYTFEVAGDASGDRTIEATGAVGTESQENVSTTVTVSGQQQASVSFSDQSTDADTLNQVTVDSATLPDGGFVVIHTTPVVPEGGSAADSVIGNSTYLEPGTTEDITITLDEPVSEDQTLVAMAHQDTNDNEEYDFPSADGPYTQNGAAVTDSAEVRVNADAPPEGDEFLRNGNRYWAGQDLYRSEGVDPGETVEVLADNDDDGNFDDLVDQVVDTNDDGAVVVSTSGLSGTYRLVDSDDNVIAQFSVNPQNLDIQFDDGSANNDRTDTTDELEFDSNRARYSVLITADGLNGEELQDAFGGMGTVDEDEDGLVLSVVGDRSFTVDFDGVAADTYNFTAEVTDTGVSDEASIDVTAPGDVNAQFEENVIQEQIGDTLEFTVNLQNTDTAEVVLGSDDVGYRVELTLEDGNDDDESVTVQMNTYLAGSVPANQVYSAADSGDSVSAVRTTGDLDEPLALTTGGESYQLELSAGGETQSVGSIFLNQRSTDSMQVWTAPSAESPDDVDELLEVVTQRSDVAEGDWVVFQVQASGLYAYLEDVGDFGSNGLSMVIEEQNPGLNQDPTTIDPSDGVLFTDEDNNQFFLAIRTDGNAIEAGQSYEATFTVGEGNRLIESEDDEESVSAEFEITEPDATINQTFDGTVILPSGESVTLSGTSSLAPGTEVTVTIQSTSDENPYLRRNSGVVGSDGAWNVTFDTSDLPDGTGLTVDVSARGTTLVSDQDGEIGTQPTPTQPETVTVTRTVERTVTRTVTRTVVQTQEVTRTVVRTVTRTVQTGGQPGFGIAVAITALLAAALLAIRRRDE